MTDITNAIKERMIYYIQEAIGGTVTTNWNVDIAYADERPSSSIKFEPIIWDDPTYGKLVPEVGAIVEITFSIHIVNDIDETYDMEYPYNYRVLDDAETLIDYLIDMSEDTTERSTYKILKIYDMIVDEISSSKANRGRNISTVEIKGKIEVKWED